MDWITRAPVVALLLGLAFGGCHRADVVDRVPISANLAAFRSVDVVLVPLELDAVALSDFREDLKTRLEEAGFRDVRLNGETGELVVRIDIQATQDGDDAKLILTVRLFDQRRHQAVGHFEVKADSAGGGGGGIQIKTTGGLTRAFDRAARAIATHLGERRD